MLISPDLLNDLPAVMNVTIDKDTGLNVLSN